MDKSNEPKTTKADRKTLTVRTGIKAGSSPLGPENASNGSGASSSGLSGGSIAAIVVGC